jgi:hypothetical protein
MPNFRNQVIGVIAANDTSVALAYRETVNGGVGIQITGTFVGTVQFEITLDGTNFVAVEATAVGNSQTLATTATAPSVWKFDAIGAMAIRVRSTVWTSGLATVTMVGLGG